jgi:hypothetical protein
MKMNRIALSSYTLISMIALLMTACGGSGDGGGGGGNVDNEVLGLRIFVTAEDHYGDFANDPNLIGNNWTEKADDFCNVDNNTPETGYYKALLVDGVTRDAVTLSDWVLQPNTKYYQSDGITLIGETNSASIFNVISSSLENPIDVPPGFASEIWTGIADATDFSADDQNCNNWSSHDIGSTGRIGWYDQTGSTAFSVTAVIASCSIFMPIYCVEQP